MGRVIKATCGECGDVELGVPDVHVRWCADTGAGTYVFRCPSCRMAVAKPAGARVVDLLVAVDVPVVTWHLPAELDEAHEGPTITHDDLIDFHRLIQSEGWFDQILAVAPLG